VKHKNIEICWSLLTVPRRYCWARRAELALAEGDAVLALEIAARLIDSAPGMSPEGVIVFLWWLKGRALTNLGCVEEASAVLSSARQQARMSGERFLLWRILASHGKLHESTGNLHEAQRACSAAHFLIEEMAANIPEQTLKDRFLQGALGNLSPLPKPPMAVNDKN